MKSGRYKGPRNRVSVWNWMGTILLTAIPGVNIIAMFLFVFLAKSQPKRSYAAAVLWLMLICVVLVFAAFMIFPAELLSFADWLKTLTPVAEDIALGANPL